MPETAGQIADAFESLVREHEERWLSPLAVRSYETRGRNLPEEECRLRTPFQRDRDRIVHSKAFRRLRLKTQVFVDPEGDHFRTRLTHTLETTGIARPGDRPQQEIALLGESGSRRIDRLVHDLVETSARVGDIAQSDEIGGAMLALRDFMFERVYLRQEHAHIRATIRRIFEDLVDNHGYDVEDATDYIAGMTDRFALAY